MQPENCTFYQLKKEKQKRVEDTPS